MAAKSYNYYRDLLSVLLSKDFKVRYRSTVLGYAWSALHPLAFMLVFFVLFKVIVKIKVEQYPLFLVCGLFPWQWFQNSVNGSPTFFLSNSALITKVLFPRFFLVLAGVTGDLIHFLISIPILLAFMLFYGKPPTTAWIVGIPLLVVAQLLFTYGIAVAVATLNLFLRDLERLTSILTMLWFYMTPVIFAREMVPSGYQWLLYLNPMAALILSWRSLFLEGTLPVGMAAAALGYGLAVCFLGQRIYKSLEWRFAEVV